MDLLGPVKKAKEVSLGPSSWAFLLGWSFLYRIYELDDVEEDMFVLSLAEAARKYVT